MFSAMCWVQLFSCILCPELILEFINVGYLILDLLG